MYQVLSPEQKTFILPEKPPRYRSSYSSSARGDFKILILNDTNIFTKLDKIYGEERRENREGIDTGALEKFSSLKSLQLLLRASCMCAETPPKGLPTPQNTDIADFTTRVYSYRKY